MLSGGGLTTVETAIRFPVRLVESGPAGGAIFASHIARQCGLGTVLSYDMGGTTAKICLIDEFQPQTSRAFEVARIYRFKKGSGLPLRIPVIEMVEIGAGGGSIARVDRLKRITVGPDSAGADPGPACYGRGGAAPSVTDADLVLGRLNGARFLGGNMTLDHTLAETAVRTIGDRLKLGTVEAALGITTIADGAMSLAVRAVSVNRGIDPRDTTLIAFGGAGPLHAVAIAREISIPRVVIPKLPGNFSALGMLMAQWRDDFVRTLIGLVGEVRPSDAKRAFAELTAAGEAALARDHLERGRFDFAADLRYRGQEHTIAIPVARAEDLTDDTEATRIRFNEQHDRRYGHAAPDQSIEIVNLRLTVSVPRMDDAIAHWLSQPFTPADAAPEQRRPVVLDEPDRPIEARVLWRPALAAGTEIAGPAVIEEPNSTTLIGPGDHAI